jgi:hypothetical protein
LLKDTLDKLLFNLIATLQPTVTYCVGVGVGPTSHESSKFYNRFDRSWRSLAFLSQNLEKIANCVLRGENFSSKTDENADFVATLPQFDSVQKIILGVIYLICCDRF